MLADYQSISEVNGRHALAGQYQTETVKQCTPLVFLILVMSSAKMRLIGGRIIVGPDLTAAAHDARCLLRAYDICSS